MHLASRPTGDDPKGGRPGSWWGTPDGNLHVRDRLRRCTESSDFRKDQGVHREEAETMAARYGNCSAGDHTHALSSSWERRGRGKRGGSSTTPLATSVGRERCAPSGRKRASQWLARQAPKSMYIAGAYSRALGFQSRTVGSCDQQSWSMGANYQAWTQIVEPALVGFSREIRVVNWGNKRLKIPCMRWSCSRLT
nr:uncharacterized protein LOC127331840 [Lolium perenne]